MICTTINDHPTNTLIAKTLNKINLDPTNEYITAGSPYTSVRQLIELAESTYAKVRRRVAENPNSPLCLLSLLLKDEDPDVRLSIASNPGATFRLIESLAVDHCADVRLALAENHHLPMILLIKLCLDENPYVAHRAQLTVSHLQSNKVAVAC